MMVVITCRYASTLVSKPAVVSVHVTPPLLVRNRGPGMARGGKGGKGERGCVCVCVCEKRGGCERGGGGVIGYE